MKSREYWQNRFVKMEQSQINKGARYFHDLERQYNKAASNVDKEIAVWLSRIAVNNEISMAEAKKFLSDNELEEFKWTLEEYIEKGKTLNYSDEWAKQLENASAKWHISRLEAMKIEMQQQTEVLYGNELDSFDKMMRDTYTESYYKTGFEIQKGFGIGQELSKLDTRKIDKVIARPWAADGENFSSRIWKQKIELVNELNNTLTQALIRGTSPDQVTEAIANRFKVSKGQAGRLVMTETAFFHSAGQRDMFKDIGVEEYEIVATLDNRTSTICQELDGTHRPMSEFQPGVTAPPFHCWCRSTTVPYFDDEFTEDEVRVARDDGGKIYEVPSDMKYSEWKEKFVDGKGFDKMAQADEKNDWSQTVKREVTKEEKKEIIEYAKERGINIVDLKEFDGDSELLKSEIDKLGELNNDFGNTKKLTVTVKEMDDDDFAELQNRTIVFNAKALRNRKITEINISKGNKFASKKAEDIAAHEFGHYIERVKGLNGLEVAMETYYNVFNRKIGVDELIKYLSNNVSNYSIEYDESKRSFSTKHYSEVTSEILAKNNSNADAFTMAFVNKLKGV